MKTYAIVPGPFRCDCYWPDDSFGCSHVVHDSDYVRPCEVHRDRVAVAGIDGGVWCADCAQTFTACEHHPEEPGGYDDNGIPICQSCCLLDAGAIEAIRQQDERQSERASL